MNNNVGPFDFLFCNKCNRHVGDCFFLAHYRVSTDDKATGVDRKNRVAPHVRVEANLKCSFCEGPLIQKYVSVAVTIVMEAKPEGESRE